MRKIPPDTRTALIRLDSRRTSDRVLGSVVVVVEEDELDDEDVVVVVEEDEIDDEGVEE